LSEAVEKLEKMENYVQTKELKWSKVEEIMDEYIQEDIELREKFRDLKINVKPTVKISNIVAKNEELQYECSRLQNQIEKLRELLINPMTKYENSFILKDPNNHKM
jgi:predicted nuclease with TOPRIM domain